jgi:predicted DCC family thiol-disulfide oxidoreductase YuxK
MFYRSENRGGAGASRRRWGGYRQSVSEPREPDGAILFFDGQCGFCQRCVRFVLSHETRARREARDRMLFAPLDGETYQRVIGSMSVPEGVLLAHGGRVLARSDAAGEILRRMGGMWRVLGSAVLLVPRWLREWAYSVIAARRLGLMSPIQGGVACMVPETGQHQRLLA